MHSASRLLSRHTDTSQIAHNTHHYNISNEYGIRWCKINNLRRGFRSPEETTPPSQYTSTAMTPVVFILATRKHASYSNGSSERASLSVSTVLSLSALKAQSWRKIHVVERGRKLYRQCCASLASAAHPSHCTRTVLTAVLETNCY